MMNQMTNAQRAQVLTHALPYIQKYTGRVLVIKYGGNAMISDHLKNAVMGDLVLLSLIGVKVVLVHSGESSVGKTLAGLIQSRGGKAIGLCGIDGGMLSAVDGRISEINAQPITDILDKGYIPVISTVAMTENGGECVIDADIAASAIAGALKAEGFISMTDVDGILREKDDPTTLISTINVSDAPRLIREGIICGGMIPKVESCIEAVRRGVNKVFIIDGRIPHSIIIETLTDEGVGTMFVGEKL